MTSWSADGRRIQGQLRAGGLAGLPGENLQLEKIDFKRCMKLRMKTAGAGGLCAQQAHAGLDVHEMLRSAAKHAGKQHTGFHAAGDAMDFSAAVAQPGENGNTDLHPDSAASIRMWIQRP